MSEVIHEPVRDLLTPGMLEALRKTKPWVRFLSIIGFLCVVLMVVIGIGVAVAGAFFGGNQGKPGFEGPFLIGMSLLYVLLGILYIFPSLYLFRYASAIGEALAAPSKSAAVENALRQQKSFWKFAGIMTLIMFLVYIPGILAAIAIPNLLTAMQRSKQKRTMVDVRTIATLLEQQAVEKGGGYPMAASIDDLARALEPANVPRVDGWGAPIVYEVGECTEGRCGRYYIASGGKNMKMEKAPAEYAVDEEVRTTNFDADIVFSNGTFVSAP